MVRTGRLFLAAALSRCGCTKWPSYRCGGRILLPSGADTRHQDAARQGLTADDCDTLQQTCGRVQFDAVSRVAEWLLTRRSSHQITHMDRPKMVGRNFLRYRP